MKKLLSISTIANLGLVIALCAVWVYGTHTVKACMLLSMDTAERHQKIHAATLSALESQDPRATAEMVVVLRTYVNAWNSAESSRSALRALYGD